jgi:hypothetical protein
MRDERELPTASFTAEPILVPADITTAAQGTEDVFSEDDPS